MQTLTLQTDDTTGKDTYLDEVDNSDNKDGETLNVGEGGIGGTHRAIIQFDISSIPSGSTISSATLTLYMENDIDTGGARTHGIHRITAEWTEDEATWDNRQTGTAWSSAGGDFDASAEDTTSVNAVGDYTWDVKSLIQEWVDGTANYGLLVMDENEGATSVRKIYTDSSGATAANRPELAITYLEPGGMPFISL